MMEKSASNRRVLNRRMVRWAGIAGVVLLIVIGAAWMSNGVLSRIARARAIHGIEEAFAGELEMKSLDISVFPRLRMTGEGLVLHYRGRKDLPPLISIARVSASAGLAALLTGHIQQVRLEKLEIQVPPKSERAPQGMRSKSERIAGFVIDEVVADGTVLKTLPQDPDREPLEWDIRLLTLHGAGASSPMSFRATLINAKPPGEIDSSGNFGPWQKDEPGDTPVEGKYTFQNADLSIFKGISGRLSSQGTYRGVLERIEAQGTTDTPDFTVSVSGNPVHLTTQFKAVVDGTDGNTWLQPVKAQFGRSSVVAQGGVEGVKGVKGKTVSLDVTVTNGRLEDLLRLGVKGQNSSMTGAVSFQAKLNIPPGNVDVSHKMKLDGAFKVAAAHFSELNVQEKVNKLSHSGKGEPEEAATDTVASDFGGQFKLANGVITFQDLSFRVPGVSVALTGTYGLAGETMDFHGTAKLEAKLSQTTTGFKSFLLKAVDPFFRKKDAGAVIPIRISGAADKPSFGLDLRAAK
jgi:hypothetical protein